MAAAPDYEIADYGPVDLGSAAAPERSPREGRPTLLCTYSLSASKSGDIFDVARAHHFAIAKRKKRWEVIKRWGQERGEQRVEPPDAANRILSLSRRERQALDSLIEGRLSKTIAKDRGISVRTVDVHRARLLDRLNVRTTAEAVRLPTSASLIRPG